MKKVSATLLLLFILGGFAGFALANNADDVPDLSDIAIPNSSENTPADTKKNTTEDKASESSVDKSTTKDNAQDSAKSDSAGESTAKGDAKDSASESAAKSAAEDNAKDSSADTAKSSVDTTKSSVDSVVKNIPEAPPSENMISLPKDKFSTMPKEEKKVVKTGPGVIAQEEAKEKEAKKAKKEEAKAKESSKEAKQDGALDIPDLGTKQDGDLGDISKITNMKDAESAPIPDVSADTKPNTDANTDAKADTKTDAKAPEGNPNAEEKNAQKEEELDDEEYLKDEDSAEQMPAIGQANQEDSDQKAKDQKANSPKVQLEETTNSSKSDTNKEVSFIQEDFYELDSDDSEFQAIQKDNQKEYVLRVTSLDLEAFVNGQSYNEKNQVQIFGVNNNFTQIQSKDGKIKEYRFFQKSAKKNTILNTMRMPLEKIEFDTYKIVTDSLPNSFDVTACKVIIKKELNAVLNQSKEVIMDLDIKRELKNTTNFKLFLECPR